MTGSSEAAATKWSITSAGSFLNAGTNTLDMNAGELILDADADTSITASTDDQIDIKIAGADDFTFTANTFTAAASSVVALDDGAVATPSLTTTGDLNTGVYFPAADTVGVTAGGTEQFRFGSIEGGANPIGTKNLLLNAGFTVAQRASVTGIGGTNYVYYATDGWTHYGTSSSGRYTASQASAGTTDGPFRYCLKVDVTTADTDVSGNNISAVLQKMEGQNLQHLHWGQTTNDYPLALSFWVKSPKAGTHCVAIYLQEGNDSCTTEYTVDSADTWQYITVDFPSPGSAIGTIDNDANASLWLVFPLMATGTYQSTADAWQTGTEGYATSNQQNLLDNTGNDFFLANVQLELGSISTSFQAEDYGTTLAKCQRYYYSFDITTGARFGCGGYDGANALGNYMSYPVTMRATPTASFTSSAFRSAHDGAVHDSSITITFSGADQWGVLPMISVHAASTQGEWYWILDNSGGAAPGGTGDINFTAEL